MAPVNSTVAQPQCGVAFAGTYPPPFCMQEPRASGSIRSRAVDLSGDIVTVSHPNSISWPTETQKIINEPRTWIGIVLGLLLLACIIALGCQCWISSKERLTRRDEEGIELRSVPRTNSYMKFKQRKERRAAKRRLRREGRPTQSSGGVYTRDVIVTERELDGWERSHENLLDETRWFSLRDTDYPLVQHRSDIDSRQPTVTHSPHSGDDSETWRHLVDDSPSEPAIDESRTPISLPLPAYRSQRL